MFSLTRILLGLYSEQQVWSQTRGGEHREIETQWIGCRVREIRTLPQEAKLNSSSPCMVKSPPKATGSPWEHSQSPAKYKSPSHGNDGTD